MTRGEEAGALPRLERAGALHARLAARLLEVVTLRRVALGSGAVAASLLAGWLVAVVALPALDGRPGRLFWPDFLSFYTAGSFVLEGRMASLYDLEAQREFQRALVAPEPLTGVNHYLNPPSAAVFYAPFAALPFLPALLAWWAAGLGALALTVGLLRRELAPGAYPLGSLLLASLAFVPTLFWFLYAQSSAFSLLLLAGSFVALRRGRDLEAGLLLGCLAYKPQLAMTLAWVLLVKGRGGALLGGAVSALLWVALGFASSPEATFAYLELSPEIAELMRREGYPTWGLSSFYGFAVLLLDGAWPDATLPVAAALSGGALIALAWRWRGVAWRPGTPSWDLMMAGTLAWGLLVSPHLYHYDLMLLLLPLAVVAASLRAGGDRSAGRVLRAWTLLLWISCALGHYLTRLQLELGAQLGAAPLAVQLPVVAVALWGALLVTRRARPGPPPDAVPA